jgi:hypothetical protein
MDIEKKPIPSAQTRLLVLSVTFYVKYMSVTSVV